MFEVVFAFCLIFWHVARMEATSQHGVWHAKHANMMDYNLVLNVLPFSVVSIICQVDDI